MDPSTAKRSQQTSRGTSQKVALMKRSTPTLCHPRLPTFVTSSISSASLSPSRWVVYNFVREGGNNLYHRKLLVASWPLQLQQRRSRVPHRLVDIRSLPQLLEDISACKGDLSVREGSSRNIGTISVRDSQEAGISYVTCQAHYVYRKKFFTKIQNESESWCSHRKSGETACTLATGTNIGNP